MRWCPSQSMTHRSLADPGHHTPRTGRQDKPYRYRAHQPDRANPAFAARLRLVTEAPASAPNARATLTCVVRRDAFSSPAAILTLRAAALTNAIDALRAVVARVVGLATFVIRPTAMLHHHVEHMGRPKSPRPDVIGVASESDKCRIRPHPEDHAVAGYIQALRTERKILLWTRSRPERPCERRGSMLAGPLRYPTTKACPRYCLNLEARLRASVANLCVVNQRDIGDFPLCAGACVPKSEIPKMISSAPPQKFA